MSDVPAEVQRLHRVLARWLGADCDPAVLTEFRDSHAADFALITTEGAVLTAEELFTALAGARNSAPGLVIEVDEIAIIAESPEFTVVRFREVHRHDGTSTARRTTAVLRRTPDGLRWQHVHETAI
ncbi:hypothetical protein SAMN02982929_06923 [Saccharopolyspora kobensis]|uniref:DUF4440 domain-containing protein n=1 Tax=Saccharopolyspora kobensis TaxID=146035 RepID=A0A1H6ELX2_9PSEU|nr:DUF4440 domain-containing protein [Saccharopolyspora kobensis]SEG97895.1 hypothetical protein SAMN02982929_06923 [Saccharopolyspora kobensis]SFF23835.1 hypothetical protein SAMN05216506_12319 [Saccharopolyspora kobensis]